MNDTLPQALKQLRLSGLLQSLEVRLQEAASRICKSLEPVVRSRIRARLAREPELSQAWQGDSDFVQDTFAAVQIALPQFRGKTTAEFRVWLLRILWHSMENRVRHETCQKRQPGGQVSLDGPEGSHLHEQLVSAEPCPDEQAALAEEHEQVANAIGQLPPAYQEVVRLHAIEGDSFTTIAKRAMRSPDAIRKLWNRAIVRLRRMHGRGEGERGRGPIRSSFAFFGRPRGRMVCCRPGRPSRPERRERVAARGDDTAAALGSQQKGPRPLLPA